jgi:hypothetical protein
MFKKDNLGFWVLMTVLTLPFVIWFIWPDILEQKKV